MWISDIDIPDKQITSTVLIAQASNPSGSSTAQQNIAGVCRTLNATRADLYPIGSASDYMYRYHNVDGFGGHGTATVKVIEPPKYGKLKDTWNRSNSIYVVNPTPGLYDEVHSDSFVLEVEEKGVKVFVHYYLYLQSPEESHYDYCDQKDTWKISFSPAPPPTTLVTGNKGLNTLTFKYVRPNR